MYNALQYTYSSTQLRHFALVSNHPHCKVLGLLTAGGGVQELYRECQRAVPHNITVLSFNPHSTMAHTHTTRNRDFC